MKKICLDDLVQRNLDGLYNVMSKKRIKLLDTTVLVGIPGFDDVIKVAKGRLMYVNSMNLKQYSFYFNKIFEYLDSFDSNITIPEVIEEVSVFKGIFSKRIKKIDNITCKGQRLTGEKKEKLEYIRDIKDYFRRVGNLLDNRRYEKEIVFNHFSMELYDLYKLFINKSYNVFRERRNEDIKNESVCADDALIAASLMLLQRKKEPMIIVSNDKGVFIRLKILKSLIYYLNKKYLKSSKITELNDLLNLEGISICNALNNNHIYRFDGTTRGRRLGYNLKRMKDGKFIYSIKQWRDHINYFMNMMRDINNLEEKYAEMI